MPYNPYPRAFQTRDWRNLYESYILDLATLHKAAKRAVLVIIDAEPWGLDDSKPAEIGVSLVPALHDMHMGVSLPRTLDALSHSLRLETHWIRVVGRERRERNREIQYFGQQHDIEDDQVEQTISNLIQQFMQKHYGQSCPTTSPGGIPLVLAGFSLDFEFRILTRLYPRVLRHFTSWSDLQEIAREVSDDGTSRLISPGLHETLVACGFQASVNDSQNKNSQHNAATDTVRAAAVFAYFMTIHGQGGEKLSI